MQATPVTQVMPAMRMVSAAIWTAVAEPEVYQMSGGTGEQERTRWFLVHNGGAVARPGQPRS